MSIVVRIDTSTSCLLYSRFLEGKKSLCSSGLAQFCFDRVAMPLSMLTVFLQERCERGRKGLSREHINIPPSEPSEFGKSYYILK